jgi:hypothetical protein
MGASDAIVSSVEARGVSGSALGRRFALAQR